MKKQIFLSMIYIGLYVCGAMVSAADTSVEDTAAAASVENNDDETAETADANDPFRIKRQHGQGGHSALSGILSSVFNKKLGLIGSLSSISSSSKGVETHHHTYDYSPPAKPFDWWSFKKSILASLLQAVKAITGGVIALNGQLVKVKGHLLAAKGHLLSTKGDSITNFGRHLATNAFNTHESTHTDVHESSVPAPSAPSGSGPGFPLTGPSNIHGSLEATYPHNEFKSAIGYPTGYFKEANAYAKRAAPFYYLVENDTVNKNEK